jgi:hypothetical protein
MLMSSSSSAVATAKATVGDTRLTIQGSWLKTARLTDEWHEDVDNPEALISNLKASSNADLFTFWQRLPNTEPKFPYHREMDSIAVLPVSTYEHWLKHQINNKTRNLVTKAAKKGVVIKPAAFDDAFVRGMAAIFNETPVRQGMPFWHYGKDVETIRREFSTFLFREDLYGAYIGDELVGFIFLAHGGQYQMIGQILSMMSHRDKALNNALIAKAVEVCAEKRIPYLVYAVWPRGPLKEFKRHNGFDRVDLPRYYVPLTVKGELALRLGLHRNPIERLPESAFLFLRDLRTKYYAWKHNDTATK